MINYDDKNYIATILTNLTNRIDIGKDNAYKSLKLLLEESCGDANDSCFGAFLASLQTKGATDDEIIGLMDCVMNFDRIPVDIKRTFSSPLCGIVGSGKDQLKTFNISSIAAIVAASCGVKVLKNGSRSESSVSGTTDIFEYLGFAVENISKEFLEKSINKLGFGFCDAKQYFPRMGTVYMGKFYFVHPLSFILPVASGCKFDRIVFGLSNKDTEKTANLLLGLGYLNSLVVSGSDLNGNLFDEISNVGPSKISEIKDGVITTYYINPEDFGFNLKPATSIQEGKTIEDNKNIFIDILSGTAESSKIEVVAMNAGALIYLSGITKSIKEGVKIAYNSIKSGKTFNYFNKLKKFNIGVTK